MEAIRDDGFIVEKPHFFRSVEDFLEVLRANAAAAARLPGGAAGAADDLVRGRRDGAAARPRRAPIRHRVGFDSVTIKHGVARQWPDAQDPMKKRHRMTGETLNC